MRRSLSTVVCSPCFPSCESSSSSSSTVILVVIATGRRFDARAMEKSRLTIPPQRLRRKSLICSGRRRSASLLAHVKRQVNSLFSPWAAPGALPTRKSCLRPPVDISCRRYIWSSCCGQCKSSQLWTDCIPV